MINQELEYRKSDSYKKPVLYILRDKDGNVSNYIMESKLSNRTEDTVVNFSNVGLWNVLVGSNTVETVDKEHSIISFKFFADIKEIDEDEYYERRMQELSELPE